MPCPWDTARLQSTAGPAVHDQPAPARTPGASRNSGQTVASAPRRRSGLLPRTSAHPNWRRGPRALGAVALACLAMIHVVDLPGTLGSIPLVGVGYLGIIAAPRGYSEHI